jgi:hypothetical protein
MRSVLDDLHAAVGQPFVKAQPLRPDEQRLPGGRDVPAYAVRGAFGQRGHRRLAGDDSIGHL